MERRLSWKLSQADKMERILTWDLSQAEYMEKLSQADYLKSKNLPRPIISNAFLSQADYFEWIS